MEKVHMIKGVGIAIFIIAILIALAPILKINFSQNNTLDNITLTDDTGIDDSEELIEIAPPELDYAGVRSTILTELLTICDSSSKDFNDMCKTQIKSLVTKSIPLDIGFDNMNCSMKKDSESQEQCIREYLHRSDDQCDSIKTSAVSFDDIRFNPSASMKEDDMFPSVKGEEDRLALLTALVESNPGRCLCISSRPELKSECQEMASYDFDIWIARSRVDMKKENIRFCNDLIGVFNLSKENYIVEDCIKYVAFVNTDTSICEEYYGETERGLECAMRTLLHVPKEIPGYGIVLEPGCDKTENSLYKSECEKKLPDYELLDEDVNTLPVEVDPWQEFSDIKTTSECDLIYSSNVSAYGLDKSQQCYLYLAKQNTDLDMCKNIISPFVLGKCYKGIAESTNDMSVCDNLKSAIAKNVCEGYLSMNFS